MTEDLPNAPTRLFGKKAVATSGAQGIGLEIARLLPAYGARVVRADLDVARTEAAATVGRHDSALAIGCDATDEGQVQVVAAVTLAGSGPSTSGSTTPVSPANASLRDMTAEDFRRVVDVHVTGTGLDVRASTSIMRRPSPPCYPNLLPIGKSGDPGTTNLSAAKAGADLTKAGAKVVADHNVRVNAVQPGLVRTAMTAAASPPCAPEAAKPWPPWSRPVNQAEQLTQPRRDAADLKEARRGSRSTHRRHQNRLRQGKTGWRPQ